MSRLRIILSLNLFVFFGAQALALVISDVSHNARRFVPEHNERVTIRFKLSEPASVQLRIYDARDWLVRKIDSADILSKGEHRLAWDGLDQSGRRVPAEAYHYTLTASTAQGQQAEYDVSDLTGGDTLEIKDIEWDKEKRIMRYLLPQSARVNIRIGLKNKGPMMRTLINWLPRDAGLQTETWDGKDQSGAVELGNHPNLDISINAFSLSDNTIFVGLRRDKTGFIKDIGWDKVQRVRKKNPKKRMHTFSQQSMDERGDYPIILSVSKTQGRTASGIPVVVGRVPVVLDLPEAMIGKIYAQRFESVFYLDGQFIEEAEVGMVPMTWYWDTTGVTKGLHYITANIRGYEGNFGTNTIQVFVETDTLP